MRYLHLFGIFLFISCQSGSGGDTSETSTTPEEESIEVVESEEIAEPIDTMQAVTMEAESEPETKLQFEKKLEKELQKYKQQQPSRIEKVRQMLLLAPDGKEIGDLEVKLEALESSLIKLPDSMWISDYEKDYQLLSTEVIYRFYNDIQEKNDGLLDELKQLDNNSTYTLNSIMSNVSKMESKGYEVSSAMKRVNLYYPPGFREKYTSPLQLLIDAISNEDDQMIDSLLAMNIPLDFPRMSFMMSPLMIASQKGDLPLVQKLVESGADINKVHENEIYEVYDALYYAASYNHLDITRYLLANGSNVSGKELARTKNPEIVKLLLENGADPNHVLEGYEGDYGWPVLWNQVSMGNKAIVELLLQAGAEEGPCWYNMTEPTDDFPNFIPCDQVENPVEEKKETIWTQAVGRNVEMRQLLKKYWE